MRTPFPIRSAAFIAALVAMPPALAGPGSIPFEPAPSPQRIATAFSPAAAKLSIAKQELALELTPALVQAAPSSALFPDRLWGVTATLRLLSAFVSGARHGFFLEPKLSAAFQQGTSPATGTPGFPRLSTTELLAGVDVGYRFAIGPIQLVPTIETVAGYCFGCGDPVDSSRLMLGGVSQLRANRVAIELRADFLRFRFLW